MTQSLKAMGKKLISSNQWTMNAYAQFKGKLQEEKACRGQRHYEQEARRRSIQLYNPEELRSHLLSRLESRARERWPKNAGELHVFLAYHVHDWEAILPRTLEEFGQVTEFDYTALGYDPKSNDWINQRERLNEAMLQSFETANRDNPIDCVVGYLSGFDAAPETLTKMARSGAAIFNFCWDDKLEFPGRMFGDRYSSPAGIASEVDLNLTNAPDSCIKYMVHGGLAKFWPEAAEPSLHAHVDTQFEFDVSFVGSCYGWRPTFMRQLADLGVNVQCFGRGWPNGPLPAEEMVRLYSRSRINLGFSSIGYSRKLMCLKGRDFEVPMSRNLYLTQHNPELHRVYEIGTEILTYRDAKDCANTVKKALGDPDWAASIRDAGYRRCLRDHTYRSRWGELFRFSGLIQ